MNYKLAILGSMGPLATAKAFELFITHTKAACDGDHIPIMVFGDSSVPDRTCAILGKGPSPVPTLTENLKLIESVGIKDVFIPCNTCHYYFDELQQSTSLHLINMVELTARYVQKKYPGTACYVLGTDGTVDGKVYERYFGADTNYCRFTPDEQAVVMNAIYGIKNHGIGFDVVDGVCRLLNEKTKAGSAVFILGCTELSVIKEQIQHLLPNAFLVDAMEVAVCATIQELHYEIKDGSTDLDVSCLSGS